MQKGEAVTIVKPPGDRVPKIPTQKTKLSAQAPATLLALQRKKTQRYESPDSPAPRESTTEQTIDWLIGCFRGGRFRDKEED